jgi:hypothetical protein
MPDAEISLDGRYRYRLWREFRTEPGKPDSTVLFVMLNPSTADALADDPTIRKCIGFGRLWGYTRLEVVNLYAFRATQPADLWKAHEPVGPDNDLHIADAVAAADLVVYAWGAHAKDSSRVAAVKKIVRGSLRVSAEFSGTRLVALGFTKAGHPKHPLMLSYDTPRVSAGDR